MIAVFLSVYSIIYLFSIIDVLLHLYDRPTFVLALKVILLNSSSPELLGIGARNLVCYHRVQNGPAPRGPGFET